MLAPVSDSSDLDTSTVSQQGPTCPLDNDDQQPSAPRKPPPTYQHKISEDGGDASVVSKRSAAGPYDTYQHFARTANRTLTTFTNEMSEILRQSIERLDNISMKVRGCVFDMEQQRVASIVSSVCDLPAEAPQQQEAAQPTWRPHDISKRSDIIHEEEVEEPKVNVAGKAQLPPVAPGRSTTAKKLPRSEEEAGAAIQSNEKQVMRRILHTQHAHRSSATLAGDGDQPDELEQLRGPGEGRTKRRRRPRPAVDGGCPSPIGKRTRQAKAPSEARADPCFDPKPSPKMADARSTKLARKFASANVQEVVAVDAPPAADGSPDGRIVRLMSDNQQDWSVIMHTQRSPTRYELKPSATSPVASILDAITLKDLEPLKAEYPRRDRLEAAPPHAKDTLLYRLVHGDGVSLSRLIDVSQKADMTGTPAAIAAVSKDTAAKVSERKRSRMVGSAAQERKPQANRPLGEVAGAHHASVEPKKVVAVKGKQPTQEYETYAQLQRKQAKRMLKRYMVDPSKAHQKYVVMVVHGVEYEGRADPRVARFLAPYIYGHQQVPPQVYTVAMMTSSMAAQPSRRSTRPKPSIREVIMRAAMEPSREAVNLSPPAAIKPTVPVFELTAPLDPTQVRAVIANVETQLSYVMNHPNIADKATMIRGLQEQMEWILSNLEQSNALQPVARRASAAKKSSGSVKLPRKSRQSNESRESRGSWQGSEVSRGTASPLRRSTTTDSSGTSNFGLTQETMATVEQNSRLRNKLVAKWQVLENPSGASLGNKVARSTPEPPKLEWYNFRRFGGICTPSGHFIAKPDQNSPHPQPPTFPETPKCRVTQSLSEDEVQACQRNIQHLEQQLGAETQQFVAEMDEAITRIGAQASQAGADDMLGPFVDAVQRYRSEVTADKSQGVQVETTAMAERATQMEVVSMESVSVEDADTQSEPLSRNEQTDTAWSCTHKEIELTLRHDMRQNMAEARPRPTPDAASDEFVKAISTPLMQDIRRELFEQAPERVQGGPSEDLEQNDDSTEADMQTLLLEEEGSAHTGLNNEQKSDEDVGNPIPATTDQSLKEGTPETIGYKLIEPKPCEDNHSSMGSLASPKPRDGSTVLACIYSLLFGILIWSLNWRYTCLPMNL